MLQKKVSIIIVSYNVQFFLELCVHSVIRSLKGIDAEIIVVDNCSSDDSCALITEKFPGVTLITNRENTGFSRANNQGLAVSSGSYVHFLNPDTVVPEDFYQKTLAYLDEHPQTGCLGPRLIDGRGIYAPDSKKSFPSFWTSAYKLAGLSRIFPESTLFNRYYAAQVSEKETAPVDILSGCCLLVRKTAMEKAGGGFDESYFMYCEDVDLCHRLGLAGYENTYFPEVTVIHYKGESTRKLSYRYMRIFYEAHALFVKKYYPKRLGAVYIFSLRTILALRNLLNWGKHLFSLFKMFLLDTLLLVMTSLMIKEIWFDSIAQFPFRGNDIFIGTILIFVPIWLLSLFLNGAYDKPFSLFKAGRGMVVGTIIVLAGYGLMPFEYRYSRGIVLFSSMTGTMVLLLTRWLLSLLNWIKLVPRGKVDYKAAIISTEKDYGETSAVLKKTQYNLEVLGRISPEAETAEMVLGNMAHLPEIQKLYRINELIFNSGTISYKEIMKQMEKCAPDPFYKIHTSGSEALIGSNNARHHAEEFSLDKRYRIGTAEARRNKRITDIAAASVFLLFFPLFAFKVKDRKGFFSNIWEVLNGRKTWVGYHQATGIALQALPVIKPAILPPYAMVETYTPDHYNNMRLSTQYAINYGVLDDLRIIWINFRFLGKKNQ